MYHIRVRSYPQRQSITILCQEAFAAQLVTANLHDAFDDTDA